MNLQELSNIAHKLVANHRGILAADESTSTIEKRFKSIGVENTEEHRRAYREMLFATPGAEKFISGVIMYDETIRQKTKAGVPFAELQAKLGIVPGIKVDKGVKELPGSPQEKITEGLDGLRERLQEYHKLGARFAKWRGVIDIGARVVVRTNEVCDVVVCITPLRCVDIPHVRVSSSPAAPALATFSSFNSGTKVSAVRRSVGPKTSATVSLLKTPSPVSHPSICQRLTS